MIHMGDEYGHTKRGNNNTYCHDSDLSWFNWDIANADENGLRRFVRSLCRLRRALPALRSREFLSGDRLQWHGDHPDAPDWSGHSKFLAFTINNGPDKPGGIYVAFNTGHWTRMVELPHWHGFAWRPIVDTSKPPPMDILVPDDVLGTAEAAAVAVSQTPLLMERKYPVLSWSTVVLLAVPEGEIDCGPGYA